MKNLSNTFKISHPYYVFNYKVLVVLGSYDMFWPHMITNIVCEEIDEELKI